MKTAFIIHGTGGNPEGNWFSWMKAKLEKIGFQVFLPAFPTPENQSLENWKKEFEKYKKYINEESIFIAHSVGPSFVLSTLEEIEIPIKACFFAAGFLGDIYISEFDTLNTTFVNRDFHWETIKNNCSYFYMCHGSNDPYVPLTNAQKMSTKLGVEIDWIQGGGHLNAESEYTEFEYLQNKILQYYYREKYEEFLGNNMYLSLATVDDEYGTWTSPVFFCREGNTLYFASQDSSRHVKNIDKNKTVSFSIFDSHAPIGKGNGIQGIGRVCRISLDELDAGLEVYSIDFFTRQDFESRFYSLFKIEFKKVFILDPFGSADTRVELKI